MVPLPQTMVWGGALLFIATLLTGIFVFVGMPLIYSRRDNRGCACFIWFIFGMPVIVFAIAGMLLLCLN